MSARLNLGGAFLFGALACVASDPSAAQLGIPNLGIPNPFAASPAPPAPPARAQPAIRVAPTGRVPLKEIRYGVAEIFKTERPFSGVVVGDPKILDINVTSDRTVTLSPIALGLTNILFLDDKGEEIANVEFMVTDGLKDDPPAVTDIGPGRVRIHNKQLLSSFTAYRCNRNACQYLDELTVKEPRTHGVPHQIFAAPRSSQPLDSAWLPGPDSNQRPTG